MSIPSHAKLATPPLRRLLGTVAAVVVACLALNATASQAHADTLELQFTGLTLSYDSGTLESVGGSELATLDFFFDDNIVGSMAKDDGDQLTPSLSLDVTIPTSGYFAEPASTGIFDVSMQGGSYNLQTNVFDFDGFMGSSFRSFAVAGSVQGLVTDDLPFGLSFDENEPIEFVLSSTSISNVVTDNGELISFNAHATGSIIGTGTVIPEPTAGALLLGSAMLLATRRRRVRA